MRRSLVPRELRGKHLVHTDGSVLLNFGSNDYLGIAMESSLIPMSDGSKSEVFQLPIPEDVEQSHPPKGASASALVCGFSPWHQNLCEQISEFEQTEATVLFPSGFAACSGVVATLPEAGDLILSDALNHASLIDGCRLSKAEKFIYPHRDMAAVKALLKSHRGRFQRTYIVTDSIFSMDGTCAPLEALCDLAEQFDAILIVDEAHATGVFGTRGSGLCEQLEVEHRVPIRIGTLSKAFGVHGGFVTGPQVVIDYLIQKARSLIFSTAAPPSVIASALRSLEIIRFQPERRWKVRQLSDLLLEQLRSEGMKSPSEGTPIVPIILGDAGKTVAKAGQLAKSGFFVPAIRPPTVPEKSSRLRISLSAAHDENDVLNLVKCLASK